MCSIVDAFSRMIVGWRVSPQMRSSMVPRRSSATGRCLSRSTLDFEIETFARLVNTRLRAHPGYRDPADPRGWPCGCPNCAQAIDLLLRSQPATGMIRRWHDSDLPRVHQAPELDGAALPDPTPPRRSRSSSCYINSRCCSGALLACDRHDPRWRSGMVDLGSGRERCTCSSRAAAACLPP